MPRPVEFKYPLSVQERADDIYFAAMERNRTPQAALIQVSNELAAALDREAQLREAIRAYVVAIGRAPNNRDEEEIKRASEGLVAALEMPFRATPEFVCGHDHRWRMEETPTRCPVCGTSTFKAVAAVAPPETPDKETS